MFQAGVASYQIDINFIKIKFKKSELMIVDKYYN